MKSWKRVLSLFLAFLLMVTAGPLPIYGEEEPAKPKYKVTFTDKEGLKSKPQEVVEGASAQIPINFQPGPGELITAITDEEGNKKNPSAPIFRDENFTVEYGEQVDVTLSVVGDERHNGSKGYKDQIIEPTKVTLTSQDLEFQKEQGYPTNKRYATPANALIKVMGDKTPKELKEDFREQVNKGYIEEMFGLKAKREAGDGSGWMYYINHFYSGYGVKEAPALDQDSIRFFFVEDYTNNYYTWFDKKEATVEAGKPLDLDLSYSHYETMGGKTTTGKYQGATIYVDGKEYKKDGQVVKTNAEGKAQIVLVDPGRHTVSAKHIGENGLFRTTMPFMEVHVTGKLSDNASLKSLSYDGKTIDLVDGQTSYDIKLPAGTSQVPQVAAEAMEDTASVSLTQASSLPGSALVKVTAPNGTTIKEYNVHFSLEDPENIVDLKTLSYNDQAIPLEEGKTEYTVELPAGTVDLPTLKASPVHESSQVEITQPTELPGQGKVLVKAKNSDKTKEYTVNFTVKEATWEGEGTEENPYLIKSLEDLNRLQKDVNVDQKSYKDKFLKLTTDLELPKAWLPLGRHPKNNYFAGNINGDNHTLTVAKGGKPLLGNVSYAKVENLNIYGPEINGYGLVDNYSVGDYGAPAIDIDNVTIKAGSKILKSGFLGGYASGSNVVNISNCKIEKEVIIGYKKDQEKIGSFAGDFNGTIKNSISYATVYGTKYVGGLVGAKGQSIGPFSVEDSIFHGSVIGTGDFVGGLVGAGYDGGSFGPSANTPSVSITNSLVIGEVEGKNKVGGLFGGETNQKQAWKNGIGKIQGNLFLGKLGGAENVAGAIGYMNSLNKYNEITENFYLIKDSAAPGKPEVLGIGGGSIVDTSAEEVTNFPGITYYDTSGKTDRPSNIGSPNHNRTDDPFGKDAASLAKTIIKADVLSEDGKDVDPSQTWVTPGVDQNYKKAVKDLEDLFSGDNPASLDKEAVNRAKAALKESINNYQAQPGKESKLDILKDLSMEATYTEEADVISPDGKDVDPSQTWVTQEVQDALDEAKDEADKLISEDSQDQAKLEAAIKKLQKALDDYKPMPGKKQVLDADFNLVIEGLENAYYAENGEEEKEVSFNVSTTKQIPEGMKIQVTCGGDEVEGKDGVYKVKIKSKQMNIIDIRVVDENGKTVKKADGKEIKERFVINLHTIKVIDFKPAPGQFVNTSWTDYKGPNKIKENSVGSGLTLGSFGGHLIVDMLQPVKNDSKNPYGVDFTVFGNAFEINGKSNKYNQEPAAVYVMKDENGDGLPDDTWYELAGSEHGKETTIRDYQITYTNPKGAGKNIPWKDSLGDSGFVYANNYHSQEYYPLHANFPNINPDQESYQGTLILKGMDPSDITMNGKYQLRFGYAESRKTQLKGDLTSPDNPYTPDALEGSGGDAFDISWAIDKAGNPVQLDEIRFIKIVSATNANQEGGTGEISPEITGVTRTKAIAEDIDALKISSEIKRDYLEIGSSEYLIAQAYKDGKEAPHGDLVWMTSDPSLAKINPVTGLVEGLAPGEVDVTVSSKANPSIQAKYHFTVGQPIEIQEILGFQYPENKKNITAQGTVFMEPLVQNQFGEKIEIGKEDIQWESLTPDKLIMKPGFSANGWVDASGKGTGVGRLKYSYHNKSVEVPLLVYPEDSVVDNVYGETPRMNDLDKALSLSYDSVILSSGTAKEKPYNEFVKLDQAASQKLAQSNKNLIIQGKFFEVQEGNAGLKVPDLKEISFKADEVTGDESLSQALGTAKPEMPLYDFTVNIGSGPIKMGLKLVQGQFKTEDADQYKVGYYNKDTGTWEEVKSTLDAERMTLYFNYGKDGIYTVVKGDLKKSIDKKDLQETIKKAEKVKQADTTSADGKDVDKDKTWVTPAVQTAFDQALKKAKAVNEKTDASQDDVNQAAKALEDAMKAYKPQAGTKEAVAPVDKVKLKEALSQAEAMKKADTTSPDGKNVAKDKTWVTPEAQRALDQALEKAKTVDQKPGASQEEVKQAIQDLKEAMANYTLQNGTKEAIQPVEPGKPNPSHEEKEKPSPRLIFPGFFTWTSQPEKTPEKVQVKEENKEPQTQPQNHFLDIQGHWAEKVIQEVANKGYFKGTSATTFSPNKTTTRAEFVTVLGRLAKINPSQYPKAQQVDIQEGSYYQAYVNWAIAEGIVKGTDANHFSPDQKITREEVATILARYLEKQGKLKSKQPGQSYQDQEQISPWAKEAVRKMTEAGIFKGQDKGNFAPNKTLTRAEFAQVIYTMNN